MESTPRLTNSAVAEMVGMSHSGVSRIRAAQRTPSWESMAKIEQHLGWTVEEQARARVGGIARYAAEFEARVRARWDEAHRG